ncbi:hypothetical protein DYB26_013860, partial [Aphanomyces astaci]
QWAGQHQTLLVGTGVVVACGAGAYYMVRRVVNEAENMTKDIKRQIAEQQRLSVHLRRTEEECKAAFLRFLPSMKSRIYKQLDLEHVVESLKLLDKNEKDTRDMLWDDAKLIGRFLVVYLLENACHDRIYAAVHERLRVDGDDDSKDTLTKQHQFLSSTMDYFFTTGLPKLIEAIEVHVRDDMNYQRFITLVSPFLLLALQDATNTLVTTLQDQLLASLFDNKQDVPLAKIIPQLKAEAAKYFKPQHQDQLWDDLTKRESLQHLTTSIFAPFAPSIPSYECVYIYWFRLYLYVYL